MGIQSFGASMLGDISQSFGQLSNAALSTAATIKQKDDDKTRLENSQKDAIATKYRSELTDMFKGLATSTDTDKYHDKLQQFNNDFVSGLRDGGVYSDSVVTWAEQDLLSSMQEGNEQKLGVLSTFSRDTMTASLAFSKANMLISDGSLSLDDATAQWQTYLDSTGANGIPATYGIPDAELFRTLARQDKADQAFQNVVDKEYGDGWNTSSMLDKVLSDSKIELTPEERAAYKKAGYEAVKSKRTELEIDSSETVAKYSTDYYQLVKDDPTTTFDTSDLELALQKYPLEYQVDGLQLLANIKAGNDSSLYNNIMQDISDPSMRADDDILGSFNDAKYSDSYMAATLLADAQQVYRRTGSIQDAVKSISDSKAWDRDMGNAKATAVKSFVEQMKTRKQTEEDAAMLEAYFASGSGITDAGTATSYPVRPGLYKGNIDLSSLPAIQNEDGTVSTVRSITIEEDGKIIVIPTVVDGKVVSDEEAIEHYHETGEHLGSFDDAQEADEYAKNLHITEEFRLAIKDMDWLKPYPTEIEPTYARQSSKNGIREMLAARVSENFINNPQALVELGERLMREGQLSPEDMKKYSKPLFDSKVDLSLVNKAVSEISEKFFKGQTVKGAQFEQNVKAWLSQEIDEDPTVITDSAKQNSLLNSLNGYVNDDVATGLLDSFSKFSDVKQDPEEFIKSLSKKDFKTVFTDMVDGKYDHYIDETAQNNLKYDEDGKIKSNWIGKGVDDLRDLFTVQKGFAASYDDLAENDPSGMLRAIVEANVLYAKSEAAAVKTFVSVFSDMSHTPISESDVVSVWTPNGWAMQDPDVEGLFWIADWEAVEKKSDLPYWKFCRIGRKTNGTLDLSSMGSMTSLGAISEAVPPDSLKKMEAAVEKTQSKKATSDTLSSDLSVVAAGGNIFTEIAYKIAQKKQYEIAGSRLNFINELFDIRDRFVRNTL